MVSLIVAALQDLDPYLLDIGPRGRVVVQMGFTDTRTGRSVTAKDIEEAYAAAKLSIDRKKLQLAEPIKALGLSDVVLKLHTKVSATLRVEVVKASA